MRRIAVVVVLMARVELRIDAEVSHKRDHIDLKVSFPMRIDAHAIARPTYLGVGVMNQIEVTVRATLKAAATSSP